MMASAVEVVAVSICVYKEDQILLVEGLCLLCNLLNNRVDLGPTSLFLNRDSHVSLILTVATDS